MKANTDQSRGSNPDMGEYIRYQEYLNLEAYKSQGVPVSQEGSMGVYINNYIHNPATPPPEHPKLSDESLQKLENQFK